MPEISEETRNSETLLKTAVTHENGWERLNALKTLLHQGDSQAFELVPVFIEDELWDIRKATIRLLGTWQEPVAVEFLIKALENKDPGLRELAATALGQRQDPHWDSATSRNFQRRAAQTPQKIHECKLTILDSSLIKSL